MNFLRKNIGSLLILMVSLMLVVSAKCNHNKDILITNAAEKSNEMTSSKTKILEAENETEGKPIVIESTENTETTEQKDKNNADKNDADKNKSDKNKVTNKKVSVKNKSNKKASNKKDTKKKDTKKKDTKKKARKSVDENDLYALSHLIYAEAGSTRCTDEMRYYVGSVVLNRVKSDLFPPKTIEGIIFQKGQYECTWLGTYYNKPTDTCVKIAKDLLEKGSVLPDNVVYQAEHKQGDGVYAKLQNIYFCYKK